LVKYFSEQVNISTYVVIARKFFLNSICFDLVKRIKIVFLRSLMILSLICLFKLFLLDIAILIRLIWKILMVKFMMSIMITTIIGIVITSRTIITIEAIIAILEKASSRCVTLIFQCRPYKQKFYENLY
jgi:hypothetical protein